jgi:hypothetical protein
MDTPKLDRPKTSVYNPNTKLEPLKVFDESTKPPQATQSFKNAKIELKIQGNQK